MAFQRSYDISCVYDNLELTFLQNAIDAINLACTPVTDAWKYVESKEILLDYNRTFDVTDTMKYTIFNHMEKVGHSGSSISSIINTLVSLVSDYQGWRRRVEERRAIVDEDNRRLETWRQAILVPYYQSMSGGGSRLSVGPILADFLRLKNDLTNRYLSAIVKTENELKNLLGNNDNDRLSILQDIIDTTSQSDELIAYKNNLAKAIEREVQAETYNIKLVNSQIPILRAAIDSRNPTALHAALHPGWGSLRLLETNEYKEAQALLSVLSSGVQVDENSA
jgi:hypothetical protein